MTLRCVPVEDLEALQAQRDIFEGNSEGALDEIEHRVKNMLATAPPPPADIAEALELAQTISDEEARGRVLPSFGKVARALLKSWGRE